MTNFDPAAIQSPRLQRFHGYWAGKRRGGSLPGRADIDPVEFPWALGFVSLYDVLPGGDIRVRLDASQAVAFFGPDLTGLSLGAHPQPEFGAIMRRTLGGVVADRAPLVLQRELELHARYWRYEVLLLPFAADGRTIDMIASVLDFGKR